MNISCTGCHGSRIQDEYKGKNEGVKGDVHWIKYGLPCFDCHTGAEMHGMNGDRDHRYDGLQEPGCTDPDCHEGIGGPEDEQAQHDETHLLKMSCETCHARPYKNCYNCHVQKDEHGVPYFKIDESELAVKIGLNPRQSAERPWEYVVLRHVPVVRDTFAYYGQGLLPNFDALPTWGYATPQNASCNACHGNAEFFLTADDVRPDEWEANKSVIVTKIPEKVEEP